MSKRGRPLTDGERKTRIGLFLTPSLIESIDALAEAEGSTRSQVVQDLLAGSLAKRAKRCTHPAGHAADNQGLCHNCGIPMHLI